MTWTFRIPLIACGLLTLGSLPTVAPAQEPARTPGGPALLGAPVAMQGAASGGGAVGLVPGSPRRPSNHRAVRAVQALKGYSGSLLAAVVPAESPAPLQETELALRWTPIYSRGPLLLGEPVEVRSSDRPGGPGIYLVEPTSMGSPAVPLPLAVITTVDFDLKSRGYLNGYHIGRYPAEGSGRTDRYAPPSGFIEVTPQNQDFRVSEHFRLRQFLTKDQHSVWPKYLALDLRLVDKLELVLQELNAMGIRAEAMHVMSGFRTPQYNGPGGDGRASLSRHTYGDAADVWVDSDADGYMDDLNGDGRADLEDARVMMMAVERVERRYPELIGGAGVYVATRAHGPFIHIDVRGRRARW
jgi:uncharacterized protein YcbK (DUF882 family)